MEFRDFTAGKDDNGRRLDRVIRIFLKDLSLGEIYKLLRKGLIKLNYKKAKPDAHVNSGDIISIAAFLVKLKEENQTVSENHKLNIVYENEHLLIIDKPYGISVHGSEKAVNSGLDKEVLAWYQEKERQKNINEEDKSLSFRPGPLHRLDRNTSGLLVFSMSLEGARWFSESIKNHTVSKKYYGLAEGIIEKTEEWIDKLSESDASDEVFHTVSQNASGKEAQTTARPLAWGKLDAKAVTLVEYSIKTGRKHQIRAQSKLHGHPLAGDKAYGGHSSKELKREYYLQAFSLSFPNENPLKLPSEIKIPLSEDFQLLLRSCEIENPGL